MSETQGELLAAASAGRRPTPYLARDAGRDNDAVKEPLRRRVMDYLTKHHDRRLGLKLFSLPGPYWSFESRMLETFGVGSRSVAVERDAAVCRRGMAWMPGGRGKGRPYWWSRRLAHFEIHGLRSPDCLLLQTDLYSLLRTTRTDLGTKADRRWWRHEVLNWTAAWLDGTSNIHGATELALPCLGSKLDMRAPTVPVALTVLRCREDGDVSRRIDHVGGGRAGYVAALLGSSYHRDCVVDEAIEYESNAHMLLLLMRMNARDDGGKPPRLTQ